MGNFRCQKIDRHVSWRNLGCRHFPQCGSIYHRLNQARVDYRRITRFIDPLYVFGVLPNAETVREAIETRGGSLAIGKNFDRMFELRPQLLDRFPINFGIPYRRRLIERAAESGIAWHDENPSPGVMIESTPL